MIGIRVDANEKIAMGHLMRCMSIAKQLRQLNQAIVFLISENYAKNFIENNGFDCICLENDYREKEEEIEQLLAILTSSKIDILLLDSYEVSYNYMKKLKENVKLAYIDDLVSFYYPVDLLINYTFGTTRGVYEEKGYKDEKLLLGSEYVPLRPEFSNTSIRIQEQIEDILITTGGTDEYNMLIGIIDKIGDSKIRKHIIAGKFYDKLDELLASQENNKTLFVYYDIANVCEIMRECDIAISAGGTTLAELCACGVPTICFSVADNQLMGTKAYAAANMMLYAGDVREDREQVINRIINNVKLLEGDILLRKALSKRANFFIDGKGAFRISEQIVSLI